MFDEKLLLLSVRDGSLVWLFPVVMLFETIGFVCMPIIFWTRCIWRLSFRRMPLIDDSFKNKKRYFSGSGFGFRVEWAKDKSSKYFKRASGYLIVENTIRWVACCRRPHGVLLKDVASIWWPLVGTAHLRRLLTLLLEPTTTDNANKTFAPNISGRVSVLSYVYYKYLPGEGFKTGVEIKCQQDERIPVLALHNSYSCGPRTKQTSQLIFHSSSHFYDK